MDKQQPAIGQFDHIGIAVKSIEQASKFYQQTLGATPRGIFTHHSGEFNVGIFDLNGFCIELIEPIDENGFLAKYIARYGEGFHHLTLQTPNLVEQTEKLEEQGVRVVEKNFDCKRGGVTAFISPRSSHGVLIQLGENIGPLNNDPYWTKESGESSE